jgi:hypothetical protein
LSIKALRFGRALAKPNGKALRWRAEQPGEAMKNILKLFLAVAALSVFANPATALDPCLGILNQNLIQNGNFTAGLVILGNGSMPPSLVANWSQAFGTPQVSNGIGCGNNGFIKFWGNQLVGEAIRQTLSAPLVAGQKYRFSACVRYLSSPPLPPYVRFRVRASIGPLPTYGAGGTLIGIIGQTPSSPPPTPPGINSATWTNIYLQTWTAPVTSTR